MKELKVNEFISLKLENKKTKIYVKNQKFRQCNMELQFVKGLITFDRNFK